MVHGVELAFRASLRNPCMQLQIFLKSGYVEGSSIRFLELAGGPADPKSTHRILALLTVFAYLP